MPPPGEVRRQREHDEQADRLDGLHAEQVHLGAAARGAAAEHQEGQRQQHRAAERDEDRAPQTRVLEVDEAGRGPDRAARRDAAGHGRGDDHVSQRIADRHIAISPSPVSSCTIGSSTASPVVSRHQRTK